MADLFANYDEKKIGSSPGVRSDLFNRDLGKTLITDFFGGVAHAEVINVAKEQPGAFTEEQKVNTTVGMEVKIPKRATVKQDFLEAVWWKGSTIRAWGSLGLVGLVTYLVSVSK